MVWSALALVLLAVTPAWAHPNVIADGHVVAGHPLRLTVLVLGDEAEFTGVDITLPVSVKLDAASAPGFTVTTTAHVVRLRGGDVNLGGTQLVLVDVTPSKAETLAVSITSQLKGGGTYRYATIHVGVDGESVGIDTASTSTSRIVLEAGALLVVAATVGILWRRRYSRA
jgi:hypothetical protein